MQTFIAADGWLQMSGRHGRCGQRVGSLAVADHRRADTGERRRADDLFSAPNAGNTARASIARGQVIFSSRVFAATNVPGFDFYQRVNHGVLVTCSTGRDGHESGMTAPTRSQQNTSVGGASLGFGGPAPDPALPIFRVTCKAGAATSFQGPTMLTDDLGRR